jgi:hypothetical protein
MPNRHTLRTCEPVLWFGALPGIASPGDHTNNKTKRVRVRTTSWAESQPPQNFFTIGSPSTVSVSLARLATNLCNSTFVLAGEISIVSSTLVLQYFCTIIYLNYSIFVLQCASTIVGLYYSIFVLLRMILIISSTFVL